MSFNEVNLLIEDILVELIKIENLVYCLINCGFRYLLRCTCSLALCVIGAANENDTSMCRFAPVVLTTAGTSYFPG